MATKLERIKNSVVNYGKVYTEKQYDGFKKKFEMPPADTLMGWRAKGFYLNEGEKKVCYTKLWVKEASVPEDQKQYIKSTFTTEDGATLVAIYANIFTIEQMHPINEAFKPVQDKMIKFLHKDDKKSAK